MVLTRLSILLKLNFIKEKGKVIMKNKKLAFAGVLTAIGVSCSTFYVPIGVAKAFPIQHCVNVLAAVILGPFYGVGMAFVTSLLRNLMGTGSLLAFPGSMCGALLSGLLYRYTNKLYGAVLGEVVGTGIFGALLAYPIAVLFLSSNAAFYGFILPFLMSTIVGSAVSLVLLGALKKTKALEYLQCNDEIYMKKDLEG